MNLWTAESNIKQRSVQQSTISAHELSYDFLRIRSIFKGKMYCLSLVAVSVAVNVEALTILTGKNSFIQFSTRMAAWLLLTFFICLHNQLSLCVLLSFIKEYKCLKNVINQIHTKNEWLLLSLRKFKNRKIKNLFLNFRYFH